MNRSAAMLEGSSKSRLRTEKGHSIPPLLTAEGVTKIYRTVSGSTVCALGSVDLNIGESDFVCILGPSGCGKSTFLRLIAGLDNLTSGRLLLDGKPLIGTSADISVVFQNPTLLAWLTVFE